jgi:WhiB family redox-sensing transcriptional regulator
MQLSALLDALADPEVDEVAARSEIPCRAFDAELWFAELPSQVEQAKSLCRQCPARAACLDGARERQEPWGVWGGELFIQGVVVARKRPRGRPRKSEVAA